MMVNKVNGYLKMVPYVLFRNRYGLKGIEVIPGKVNVEYFPMVNVGDLIGPVIVQWMLDRRNIDPDKKVNGTKHLDTVGSIVSLGFYDATVWGSGVLGYDRLKSMRYKNKFLGRKLDVRAVRGPVTRDILVKAGYECPEIYGDPAILMPLLYKPETKKKYEISLILHHRTHTGKAVEKQSENPNEKIFGIDLDPELAAQYGIHLIDPKTKDYKFFIDEICASKKIISSSLHGIIFAEAFGVPAVFFNFGVDEQNDKYNDWYLSTGRTLTYYRKLEDALKAEPQPLPDLENLRQGLLDSFPYDLWEN